MGFAGSAFGILLAPRGRGKQAMREGSRRRVNTCKFMLNISKYMQMNATQQNSTKWKKKLNNDVLKIKNHIFDID